MPDIPFNSAWYIGVLRNEFVQTYTYCMFPGPPHRCKSSPHKTHSLSPWRGKCGPSLTRRSPTTLQHGTSPTMCCLDCSYP
jgi:hypothetical protein